MQDAIENLKNGKIGVLATDTIYGVVGQALNPAAVERIYAVKQRRPNKPFIILISSIDDLELFDVELNEADRRKLDEYWPGPVSVILPCPHERFHYLHRGTDSLAFRLPDNDGLREVIKTAGPLVAPSANPEGQPPAEDLDQAREYFGESVDFYFGRPTTGKSSKLIRLTSGHEEVLRD